MFKYLWIIILVLLYGSFTIAAFYDLYSCVFGKCCDNCWRRYEYENPHCTDLYTYKCFERKRFQIAKIFEAELFTTWLAFSGVLSFLASLIVYVHSL